MKKPNLTSQAQHSKDLEYYNATMDPKCKISTVTRLIREGANPFGYLVCPGVPVISLFEHTLVTSNYEIIKSVLNCELDEFNNKIDLTKRAFDDVTRSKSSFFQMACVTCNIEAIKVLYNYAKKIRLDVDAMLNADFMLTDPETGRESLEPLGIVLIRSMSTQLILANMYNIFNSRSEHEEKIKYLTEWSLNVSKTQKNFGAPIKVMWRGPLEILEYLFSIGLDPRQSGLADLVNTIANFAKDPATWNEIENLIAFNTCFQKISGPTVTTDGKVCVQFFLRNFFDKHPIQFEITVDYTDLNELVQRTVRAQQETNPLFKPLAHQFAAHKEEFAALKDTVADLTEVRRKEIQKQLAPLPHSLQCFNLIESMVKNWFMAREIASTKLFTPNSTTVEAKIAKTAVTLVSMVTQAASFPGANAIPTLIGLAVDYATQTHAKNQSVGVVNATLGQDTERLAIDIATILITQILARQGDKPSLTHAGMIANLVIGRIDELHKYKFADQQQILAFLCEPAMEYIAAKMPVPTADVVTFTPMANRALKKSDSPTSSKDSSGSTAIAAMPLVLDEEDMGFYDIVLTPGSKKAGACCTIS